MPISSKTNTILKREVIIIPIQNAILSTIKEVERRKLLFQKLIGGLAFLIPFLIYLKTLAPTVTWRDGGDFATACYVLGIPHPTGYPLYVLLGKLFTFLPVGDVAYRLNLMSAIFAAGTCFVVYHIVLHLTQKLIPAFLAALCLAFSFTFWTQAIIVEVYSLNAFFLSTLIFLLLLWRKTQKTSLLYLFAFICGLSFANHVSTIFIVPAAIVFILMVDFHKTIRKTPILFGLFLLGLTPYLYLPIRSAQNPPLDWGNPETFKQFLWVVTAAQYRGSMFSGGLSQVLDSLTQYRIAILNEFTIFGCLVGIIGFFSIITQVRNHPKRYLPIFLLFLVIFLADLIYTINFRIPDAPPFYIPSYVIFAIFLGLGIDFLISFLGPLQKRPVIMVPIFLLICFLLPFYALVRHYSHVDMSDLFEPREYGESAFRAIEENALIFTSYDGPTFVLWYYQNVVYKNRKRALVISMPLLGYDWYQQNLKQAYPKLSIPEQQTNQNLVSRMIEENLPHYPIYIYFPDSPPSFLGGYELKKVGPLHRILHRDSESQQNEADIF